MDKNQRFGGEILLEYPYVFSEQVKRAWTLMMTEPSDVIPRWPTWLNADEASKREASVSASAVSASAAAAPAAPADAAV